MEERKKSIRIVLVGAILTLIGLIGVALTVIKPGGDLSYTGSPGNPSPTAGALAAAPPADRPPAGEIRFADAEGRPLALADFHGKVVLVNLWATWCPPCVAEMPALDSLQRQWGGPDFQVVAIALDRGGVPVVQRWMDRNKLGALAIHTADTADFQGALLPTSILIDRAGRVAWQGSGAKEWDGPEAVAVIRAVMAEGR